jgi:hypothetical protein
MRTKLLKDIYHRYELKLARMEKSRLHPSQYVKRLAYYESVDGQKTNHYLLAGLSEAEDLVERCFKISATYGLHSFFPFKAKFHPQMIKALLNYCCVDEKDVVLDPLSGSATLTLVCKELGIPSIGIDINPLYTHSSDIKCRAFDGDVTDDELYELAELWNKSGHKATTTKYYKNMVQSVEFIKQIRKELKIPKAWHRIENGDALNLDLDDESVSCVVTSPPYAKAISYTSRDRGKIEKLGYDPEEVKKRTIGLSGNYLEDLRRIISECYRVSKPSSYFVIINHVKFDDATVRFAKECGYSLDKRIIRPIFGGWQVKFETILIFKK